MAGDDLTVQVDDLQEILRWVVLKLAHGCLHDPDRSFTCSTFFTFTSHFLASHWDDERLQDGYIAAIENAMEKISSGAMSLDELVSLAGDADTPPLPSPFGTDFDFRTQVHEIHASQRPLRISTWDLAESMRWGLIVLAYLNNESEDQDVNDLIMSLTTQPAPAFVSQLRESSVCGVAIRRSGPPVSLEAFCGSLPTCEDLPNHDGH